MSESDQQDDEIDNTKDIETRVEDKIVKSTPIFWDDKPYNKFPVWAETRLKLCITDVFKDIKFFIDSGHIGATPHLLDCLFKSL